MKLRDTKSYCINPAAVVAVRKLDRMNTRRALVQPVPTRRFFGLLWPAKQDALWEEFNEYILPIDFGHGSEHWAVYPTAELRDADYNALALAMEASK